MDLRHLRALIAVVEADGFARPAARLRVGQPALPGDPAAEALTAEGETR